MSGELHERYMARAITLAGQAVEQQTGGPFGAVIVLRDTIIGEGQNRVLQSNDPTAHAEMVAIRQASHRISNYNLQGAVLYTSCEPCPMCLGAIYWSRIEKIYYAANRADAARIGFDDHFFYDEFDKHIKDRSLRMEELNREQALSIFHRWQNHEQKQLY